MRKFFRGLFYERGTPGRTGIFGALIIVVCLFVWAGITIYLVLKAAAWTHYEVFSAAAWAGITTGAGMIGYNKYVSSRYNSCPGELPDKAGGMPNAQ
jgi:hypothetical protein